MTEPATSPQQDPARPQAPAPRPDPGAWTLPNLLTMLRVLAAPLTALVFAFLPRPMADLLALALFILAALTDYLDGWLARRLNQVSALGRMLDPVADKAMVTIALATVMALRGPHWLILIPAAAILLRETLVSGLREALAGRAVIHVTRLAKWKTAAQMAALGLLLAAGWAEAKRALIYWRTPSDHVHAVLSGQARDTQGLLLWTELAPALEMAGTACLWIAALLTVVTGYDYLRRGVALLMKGEG